MQAMRFHTIISTMEPNLMPNFQKIIFNLELPTREMFRTGDIIENTYVSKPSLMKMTGIHWYQMLHQAHPLLVIAIESANRLGRMSMDQDQAGPCQQPD